MNRDRRGKVVPLNRPAFVWDKEIERLASELAREIIKREKEYGAGEVE